MRRNKNFQRLEAGNDKGTKLVLTRDGNGYVIYVAQVPYQIKFVAYSASWGAIKSQYDFLVNHPEVWEHLEAA